MELVKKPGIVVRIGTRRAKEIEYVLDKYRAAHPKEAGLPLAPERVAKWAMDKHLLRRPVVDPTEILRKRIVTFLARATQIDPQGREVRANAVNVEMVQVGEGKYKRRSRWLPLFDAPEDFARRFFQWRRNGALADVVAMEQDRESYNDNNKHGVFIEQSVLDFTTDVEEKKLPTSYPSSAPEGHDDDDDKGPI